ncbi:ATP-binding cassette domain-containing protein [Croceicoccus sp. F390]|uniref:ATP-binding cassette domain-containing protein n=1 Tax=Croceicoccus esteveae TaxID=3075597 RepID=A0ABU2ZE68_9SPHN|nr:ATP-binding cassette domain-containing protein [Croceicoccus sp. F390]MDT0574897.1 ATP-binding cassette domain-containing protein [Croceicoccus sp. F390]
MSFDIDIRHRIGSTAIAATCRSHDRLIALSGPSGVGKTTVLNCIAGLQKPEQGRIVIAGLTLFDSDSGIDLAPEKRRCGYVFQDNRLFLHRRVGANLVFGEALHPPQDRWITRDAVIELLGLAHLLERWPANLSGGEMKRVAIGRALLSAPRFLLLDEPLASVDQTRREEILTVVQRIRDDLAIPIIYVSHEAAELARLTSTIITMEPPAR